MHEFKELVDDCLQELPVCSEGKWTPMQCPTACTLISPIIVPATKLVQLKRLIILLAGECRFVKL